MGALIDVIAEGIKKFGGEIVGGILFAVVLWAFPGLRKFFRRDDYEIQHELEEMRREEERLKAELKQREEELSQAKARQKEEAQRHLEAQKQTSGESTEAKLIFEQGKKLYDARKYKRAETLIIQAANQGYAEAQYYEGIMFFYGYGVKRNYKMAILWFYKAAKQEFAQAQYWLGFAYTYGFGVAVNLLEARKWYQKATEQGLTTAKEALKRLNAQ